MIKTTSKKVYNKVRSSNSQIDELDNYFRETGRKNRKNFNWEVSKSGSRRKVIASYNNAKDKLDKNSETSI